VVAPRLAEADAAASAASVIAGADKEVAR
jgi:hypothetical protein